MFQKLCLSLLIIALVCCFTAAKVSATGLQYSEEPRTVRAEIISASTIGPNTGGSIEQLVTAKVLTGSYAGQTFEFDHTVIDHPKLAVRVQPGDEVSSI